jgi:hypothetical protein
MKHKPPRDKDCPDAGPFLQMQMIDLLSSNRGVSTASVSRNSMALGEYARRGRRGSWILLSGSPDGIQPTHLRCCVTMKSKQNLQARTCLLSCLLNDRSRLAPGPGGEDVPIRNSVADRDGRPYRQSVTVCLSSRIGSRKKQTKRDERPSDPRGALMQSMILRAEIIGRFMPARQCICVFAGLADEPDSWYWIHLLIHLVEHIKSFGAALGKMHCILIPFLLVSFFLFFLYLRFLLESILPVGKTRQVTAVVVAPREDTIEVSPSICLNPAPDRGILSLSFRLVDTFFLVLPFLCLSRLSTHHCLVASTRPRGVRLLPKGAPSCLTSSFCKFSSHFWSPCRRFGFELKRPSSVFPLS